MGYPQTIVKVRNTYAKGPQTRNQQQLWHKCKIYHEKLAQPSLKYKMTYPSAKSDAFSCLGLSKVSSGTRRCRCAIVDAYQSNPPLCILNHPLKSQSCVEETSCICLILKSHSASSFTHKHLRLKSNSIIVYLM